MAFQSRHGTTETLLDKWLTPQNFAVFLALVLMVVLSILTVKSVQRLVGGADEKPRFIAMNGDYLRQMVESHRSKFTIVTLYDSECEICDRQIANLYRLQQNLPSAELQLVILSTDKTPQDADRFLDKHDFPKTFMTYYAAPNDLDSVKAVLRQFGMSNINRMPYSMLVDFKGRKITEYQGYVQGDVISDTLQFIRVE